MRQPDVTTECDDRMRICCLSAVCMCWMCCPLFACVECVCVLFVWEYFNLFFVCCLHVLNALCLVCLRVWVEFIDPRNHTTWMYKHWPMKPRNVNVQAATFETTRRECTSVDPRAYETRYHAKRTNGRWPTKPCNTDKQALTHKTKQQEQIVNWFFF